MAPTNLKNRVMSIFASALGIKPMLDLEMRLGEGDGCPMAFQVIKGACAVMCNMTTLEEGNVEAEYLKKA